MFFTSFHRKTLQKEEPFNSQRRNSRLREQLASDHSSSPRGGKNDQYPIPARSKPRKRKGPWTIHHLPKPGSLGQTFTHNSYEQNEKEYGRAYVWEAGRPGWQLLAVHQSQSVTTECIIHLGPAHQGASPILYQPIHI